MEQEFRPGLEGVIVSETAISFLDVAAEQIVIRGYDLIELAQKVRFVDVVGLLIDGELPEQKAARNWKRSFRQKALCQMRYGTS